MTIFSVLDAAAARYGDRPAVFQGVRPLTDFRNLRHRALRIAGHLAAMYPPGSRIAVFSENRPEYLELMFGIWGAGMVFTPINCKLHPKEALAVLEDSQAEVVYASEKLAPALVRAIAAAGSVAASVQEIGQALMVEAPALLQPADGTPDDLAWLFFTSGTTGRSKGAMLSHRNLMAMSVAHLADIDPIDGEGSLIHGAPLSHGSGLYVPAYVMRGARQVIPESNGFAPDEFLRLCDIHPACRAFFAPTMVHRLRRAVEKGAQPGANLHTIIYGGGPMYLEDLRQALAVFGDVFAQIYGQGESPMTISGLARRDYASRDEAILASVGYARSGIELRVVDGEGRDCAPDEPGEILCRGDTVMKGYWRDPAATAETLQDGWLRTGDVGVLRDDGLLTLRDRSKDVIISGGTNIYPREVEEALLADPRVDEVSVLGVPDADWGEAVVACIVPREGYHLDEAALDALCLSRIARFKKPKRYVFLSELPKNNYGKVAKRTLRESLIARPT